MLAEGAGLFSLHPSVGAKSRWVTRGGGSNASRAASRWEVPRDLAMPWRNAWSGGKGVPHAWLCIHPWVPASWPSPVQAAQPCRPPALVSGGLRLLRGVWLFFGAWTWRHQALGCSRGSGSCIPWGHVAGVCPGLSQLFSRGEMPRHHCSSSHPGLSSAHPNPRSSCKAALGWTGW